MTAWLVAALLGLLVAAVQYGWREQGPAGRLVGPAILRGSAVAVLVALLLDAPAGRGRVLPARLALDVSHSWLRAADTSAWRAAAGRVPAGKDVFLLGDSARLTSPPALPADAASGTREVVDRALAEGRAIVLLSDGEVDDPAALDGLPAGSRIDVIRPERRPDAALVSIDAPPAAMTGDTLRLRITVAADAAGAPSGRVALSLGTLPVAALPFTALGAYEETAIVHALPIPDREGPLLLRAVLEAEGDREARNDTLTTVIEVTRGAAAVFVSTEPDFDARYVMAAMRGGIGLPTRGFLRVAPGQWRREGTLTPVLEAEVRAALRAAPIAVVHGDTALFGAPRTITGGALLLIAPPGERGADWFAVAAPASPLAGALATLPWDSLAPLTAAPRLPPHDWIILETARARRFERRAAIVGIERPRRTVVVGASGFWRWQFRGGVEAEAFTSLWGSIFDWLAVERRDGRAAVVASGLLRAGEPVAWRRGRGEDSMVVAAIRRRGGQGAGDSVRVAFGAGATAQSPPLAPGIYEISVPGGTLTLAVNQSLEWLPRRPRLESRAVGGAPLAGAAPPLRSAWWAYALVLVLLCAEWLVRRRIGLR